MFGRFARRRKSVPLVLQMEIVECGAACLGMVLASFGRWVPLEELRERCSVSRNGVSAADVVIAAKSYGLETHAYSHEVEALKSLPLPQILFWDFDHFVVLEGWSRGNFHIADPANGRRTLPAKEFSRHFTGVTLTFAPGASFSRSRRPAGILSHLFGQARQSLPALSLVFFASFLLGLVAILIPSFTQIFIDEYLGQGFDDWLAPLLGAMLVTTVLRTTLAWLQTQTLLALTAKITIEMSAGFIWRMLHLPFGFFLHRSTGEISTRAQMGGIAGAVTGPLVTAGISLLNMTMFAVAMTLYSPPLTAVCIGFAIVNLVAWRLLERLLRESSVRLELLAGSAHATAIQGMALVEDYKSTGTETLLFERLMDAELRHVDAEQRMGRARALATVVPHFSNGLMAVAVLGIGTLQVLGGGMTIGMLVGFYMLAEMFGSAMTSGFGLATALQTTSGAVVRVRDTLDQPPDPIFSQTAADAPAPVEIGRLTGPVTASGLRYAYGNGPEILHGIDLAFSPGEMVAIVGPSGCGKSTLGRLLIGLMRPTSGELRLDGRLLADIPEAVLRSSVGYVDQLPYLFSGRLRDNLTLWDATVETDAVVAAARDAAMHERIVMRPGAYDGRVGENGLGFSGGERQMLAIARALVHEPSFLVLDEATSALDTRSEEHVMESLRRRSTTCVLITHRPSAIRFCRRVIVMEAGMIVADGPPSTVLSPDAAYARLIEKQA